MEELDIRWFYTAISLLAAILIYPTLVLNYRKLKNRPIGPRGLPFVGYLPFLSSKPHKDFYKLSRQYGDVIGVTLGSNYFVVMNSAEAAKEALHSDGLLARPLRDVHLSEECKNLLELEYEAWREHKRFNSIALKAMGVGGHKMEQITTDQVQLYLDELEQLTGQDVDIRQLLTKPVQNIIYLMVTGTVHDPDGPKFKAIRSFNDVINRVASTSYFINMPLLTPFIALANPVLFKGHAALKIVEKTLKSDMERHEKEFDPNNPVDYFDHCLLELTKRKNGEFDFSKNTAIGTAMTFILAGSDTTRSSIEFVLLQMAHSQDVQAKVYAEIGHVIGTDKAPSWDHKPKMHYTNAAIAESFRRNSIAGIPLIRRATHDVIIQGFNIPKGARVGINTGSIHMDPRYWDEPERFKPERFLTPEGTFINKTPNYFLPFSYGKRMCPGERLAVLELFIVFVWTVQRFKILPPSGGVKLESICRGTMAVKYPILKFEKR